jgi:hypothetical protein
VYVGTRNTMWRRQSTSIIELFSLISNNSI